MKELLRVLLKDSKMGIDWEKLWELMLVKMKVSW